VDPASLTVVLALALAVAGAGILLASALALGRRRRDRALGALVAIDAGDAATLRSARYRLSGRPDVLRRLPDGRIVPIELKSRPTPAAGPTASHRIQVAAYCLLVEEATGRAPPFGVVRYGDGAEFRLPWDAAARAALLRVRAEIDRPYDGRASPSRAKCARCGWRSVCDARATSR
jgi:CRISPR-associated exonuclease Cas4